MRLNLLLPEVKPDELNAPKQCAQEGCPGKRFYPRQAVEKKIIAESYQRVQAARIGDLDALAWLEADCIGWGELIELDTAALVVEEIYRPVRKPRRKASRKPHRSLIGSPRMRAYNVLPSCTR